MLDAAASYPQINRSSRAPVVQLDRASDYGSEGLRFESPRARGILWILLPLYCLKQCERLEVTRNSRGNWTLVVFSPEVYGRESGEPRAEGRFASSNRHR